MIATGVARPSAHGHDTTRTDIPLARAYPTVCPIKSHTTITIAAIAITTGTNTPDILSAILATGALVAAASLTIDMICESVVSSPTRVARHFRNPDWLRVAVLTLLPSSLSTGIDSPVSADSFTADIPSMTTPSTGMFSPGLTTKTSPITTSSMSTVFSMPSLITLAVLGASFIRLFKASVVLPFEYDSSILPTVIRVKIIAADSK